MAWLLKPEVAQAMRAARALGYQPTLEERAKFAAQMQEAYAARDGERPTILAIAGDTAEILVEGVLTEKPDCFALLFGGGNTTYEGIRKSLAIAESDPSIKKVVMNVASPGGSVRGLFETLGALEAFSKPITVNATLAASAAYGIAAAAGPITLQTLASEVGSIGVAVDIYVDDDLVQMTSTEAPNKRPDVRTEEGQGVIRDYLDAFHELFVDTIARGRSASTGQKITTEQVNAEFGRGAVMLAKQAKAAGMVDRIAPQPKRTRPGARAESEDHEAPPAPSPEASAAAEQENIMNAEELKTKHPELHAALIAEGEKAGATEGAQARQSRT
jgi:ClpP class serine protease